MSLIWGSLLTKLCTGVFVENTSAPTAGFSMSDERFHVRHRHQARLVTSRFEKNVYSGMRIVDFFADSSYSFYSPQSIHAHCVSQFDTFEPELFSQCLPHAEKIDTFTIVRLFTFLDEI